MLDRFLQTVVRLGARVLLGAFFRRVELFHPERVPSKGPVLLTPNHPASLTDALVVATSLPRAVHFVGTVQLFRFAPLGWLLRRCGIIPINRVKDDPRAMRSVLDTFEKCYAVLERGEALAIFPEGVTYDDDQLRPLKTGPARLALELEQRHGGTLGLLILPVGLSYAAKDRYRSDLLVNLGQPLPVSEWLDQYSARRKETIASLTEELERRLQALVVHLPELELARVVQSVRDLYLDEWKAASRGRPGILPPRAEDLVLTQTLTAAAARVRRERPDQWVGFVRRLRAYENLLRRLRLPDEAVRLLGEGGRLGQRAMGGAVLAVAGFPLAFYGWVHRLVPVLVIEWAARRFTVEGTRRAQTSIASMLSGLVAFGLWYALCISLVHAWLGWPTSVYYALSLPLSGVLAHYYLRAGKRWLASVRTVWLLLRAPWLGRVLHRRRRTLVREVIRSWGISGQLTSSGQDGNLGSTRGS